MIRPETTRSEIRSWSYPRQGCITQRVHGSHVDITVRLGQLGQRCWSSLVAIMLVTELCVFGSILQAFLSGRVQQVLDNIRAVHQ